jgi:6-phosphogluconolactonase (cycloisomerase 2 family)
MLKSAAVALGAMSVLGLGLSACGGGGGGPPPPPPPPTYTIGVSVSGLSGSGLALSNNGSDTLTVSANGAATFTKAVAAGGAYAVTVATQPASPSQTCAVANGTGTVGSANVTGVSVTCATNSYPVHATVSGLSGSGLVIQNNFGDDLAVATSGATTFATQVPSGSGYNIAVLTQPSNPVQICTVANGSGTVTSSAISTPAINCVTQTPWTVVTVNVGDGSLSLFALDPVTGQPRVRGRYAVGSAPTDINGDGQGRFLYVLNSAGSISGFQYDLTTSLLKPITSGPFDTGLNPNSLTGYPGSKTLYEVNVGSNDIYAYSIDQTTGALSLLASGPVKAGTNPGKLTLDAAGRFAYVTNSGSNDVYSYGVDATTGALTEIPASRVSTGTSPLNLNLDRTGKFAYVASSGSADISAYTVNPTTGVLTPIAGSPFANNGVPSDALLHPNGKLVFVRSEVASKLSVFTIDPVSGALRAGPGSPYSLSNGAVMQTLDQTGRLLFVANQGSPPGPGSISVLKVDVASGALTEVSGSPFPLPGNPTFLTVDPSGQFLYASSVETDRVYAMKIDPTIGTLTALSSGAVVLTGDQPYAVLAIPSVAQPGKTVTFSSKVGYVANSDDSISGYTIDATGKLTSTPNSPVQSNGAGVNSLAVAPGGKLAYSANTTSSNVSLYDIDQTTGRLTPRSVFPQTFIYTGPTLLAIDAADQSAFVVSNGNSTFSTLEAYQLDPTTGVFGNGGGQGFAAGQPPSAIAVGDSNRFMFGIRNGLLESYATFPNPSNLASAVPGAPAVSASAAAVAVHPSGLFVYLANADTSGTIQTFAVASAATAGPGTAGALSGGASTPTGSKPLSIAIEPTGHFLYTANSGSDNVSGFSIDQTTGALAPLGSGPFAAGHHPISVTADYSGKFLYAVSDIDKQVLTYTIDPNTGALQATTQAATGPSPKGLAISSHVTLQ